jgi:hypothetical protein
MHFFARRMPHGFAHGLVWRDSWLRRAKPGLALKV